MSRSRRPIFLVGFMGSGKSTVGRQLAGQLGWSFADTDQLIEEREGKSIEAIFRDSGEGYFRQIESQVIKDAARPEHVIAAGGGAFLSAANRQWMHQTGCTVWLDVSLERVRHRVGEGAGRPLWARSEPLIQRVLYERRRAVYALAGLRIAAADGAPETLADRILGEIP